jgi:hypothetical protein
MYFGFRKGRPEGVSNSRYFFISKYDRSLEELLEGLDVPYTLDFNVGEIRVSPYGSRDFLGTLDKLMVSGMKLVRTSSSGSRIPVSRKRQEELERLAREGGEEARKMFLPHSDF